MLSCQNQQIIIGIVDDKSSIRELLQIFFENEGFQTYTAENGLQAVELVKNQEIDLLLMDLRMPQMNGLEALTEIIKNKPQQKVMIMTAYGEENILEQAIDLGAYDYVSKPFDLFELSTKIQNILAT